mmetsp:Transcript_32973/g.62091  ORF Transcript_32973/g.62091 Transcript_32973/m.62091 type:complete len:350 (+) Transcript_32973:118-1167(+)
MVRVSFVGEARGRGLLATRRISKGEVFLIETPLVSVQDVSTSAQVLACGCCMRFVGSLDVQAAVASGARSRIHVLETELPTASLPNLPDNQTNMLSEIWPCQQGCGAVYCSSVCRDSDWARGHRLLCVGLVSEEEADTHALVQFKRDADWPVDSLALLAKAAAHVVCRYHENGGNLQAAMEPYTYFDSLLWWELGSGSANTTKTQRQEWAERASYLLHQALADGSPDFSPMFNTESFGRILGMLEMNQLAIVLESPLVQYSHEVARLSSKHAGLQADALAVLGPLAWKLQCLQDVIAQSDSEDDSEDEVMLRRFFYDKCNCMHFPLCMFCKDNVFVLSHTSSYIVRIVG